jgi:hypothetical protein
MFNWFQKNNKSNSILTNWIIRDIEGFKKIINTDSIQYTNEDNSIVIYLSLLITSGGNSLVIDAITGEPKITEDSNGWQLKGAKTSNNKILVCVISVKNWNDIDWAKVFFESISPCGNPH